VVTIFKLFPGRLAKITVKGDGLIANFVELEKVAKFYIFSRSTIDFGKS